MPFAVKHLQQLLRSEPFAFILHSRNPEGLKESLLHRRNPFEFAILKCQRSLLPGVKPPPFAVAEGCLGLGVKLGIVDRLLHIDDTREADTDIPAGTGSVGKQVVVIAGGNERGVTSHFFHTPGIGTAKVGIGLLEQVLQERLLPQANLVILIEIDEQKTAQCQFRLAPVAHVKALGISETQFWRQDATAER